MPRHSDLLGDPRVCLTLFWPTGSELEDWNSVLLFTYRSKLTFKKNQVRANSLAHSTPLHTLPPSHQTMAAFVFESGKYEHEYYYDDRGGQRVSERAIDLVCQKHIWCIISYGLTLHAMSGVEQKADMPG